jgi:hypothetical protein
MAPQAGFVDFSQPAAAIAATAAPAASAHTAFNVRVMEQLQLITERLDQQAAQQVVAPSVPASVATPAAQEAGRAVATMAQDMLGSDTGEYFLGLGRMALGFWDGKGTSLYACSPCCFSALAATRQH